MSDLVSLLLAETPVLLPAAVLLLPAPLLRVQLRREPLAFWLAVAASVLGCWLLLLACGLPVLALQHHLGR